MTVFGFVPLWLAYHSKMATMFPTIYEVLKFRGGNLKSILSNNSLKSSSAWDVTYISQSMFRSVRKEYWTIENERSEMRAEEKEEQTGTNEIIFSVKRRIKNRGDKRG